MGEAESSDEVGRTDHIGSVEYRRTAGLMLIQIVSLILVACLFGLVASVVV